MFDALVGKLGGLFKKLRSKGKLSEQDVDAVLKELRMVLLESDVHFRVVKDLVARVRERAVGKEVLESVTPGEMVIKVLWEEIRIVLGGSSRNLDTSGAFPALFLLVGLQGSGKTTTCGKLATLLKKRGMAPLLTSTDTRRPAAKNQLGVLAGAVGVDFFDDVSVRTPLAMANKALVYARSKSLDCVVVDTAGRLHVEEELLAELKELVQGIHFQETFLVLDATTGQEAVKVAQAFQRWVNPTGLILTKIDTDARGGAVLSIVAQTGWPVKLVGMGEKMDQLEIFHPERMASRIMGMGDTLTLIEKIERAIDDEEKKKIRSKFEKKELDLSDFLEELKRVKNLGSMEEIMGMLPGHFKVNIAREDSEKSLKRVEAIVQSMTFKERSVPGIINASRKKRIALGSGTTIQDVNKLLKQFDDFRKLWKQMHKGGKVPRTFQKRGLFGWGM
ncbi:MAG TPA: signal recognition particle protein [Atribacteraceae bacterium]|nr:signal recognition particle protein [Atribacteraceae bacterium]